MIPTSATTRVAAVIGSPVRHSLSPVIHNAAFSALGLDWTFLAFDVPPGVGGAAVDAMRVLGIEGLSVTMPHKDAVVPRLDRLSPAAEALGAVNCIARQGQELVGHSTDGAGLVDSLLAAGVEIDGARVAVVGAGGAARAVVVGLADAGARSIGIVNRTGSRAEAVAGLRPAVATAATQDAVGDADIVVNATSVGMAGTAAAGQLPVDVDALAPGQTVVDIVYEPVRTPLLVAAAQRGLATVDGLGMLVHQAAHAFRLWTGEAAPVDAMQDAVATALAAREH